MTQTNKFEDINDRFMSLETGMTRQHKFKDRWWIYLLSTVVGHILPDYIIILSPSLKASIPRIRASQTYLTLTNFIEKSINMYNIK